MSSCRSVIPDPRSTGLVMNTELHFPEGRAAFDHASLRENLPVFSTPAAKARGMLGRVVWPALGRPLR